MIEKKVVENKLRNIEQYMRELQDVKVSDLENFRKNTIVKRFIERNIELSIEQMIDICKHIVSGLNLREPETYADCFQILAEQSVIPSEKLEIFKSMARFRNILIHGYGSVNDTVTYDIYRNHLTDFKDFILILRNYMQR